MKKIVIALMLGMLIGSTGTTLAAVEDLYGTEIKAMFAQFNLKVYGVEKKLETAPLVYNGTAYVPLRELGNLLGNDVTYKADTRTIELTAVSTTDNMKVNITSGGVNMTNDADWLNFDDLYNLGIVVHQGGKESEAQFKKKSGEVMLRYKLFSTNVAEGVVQIPLLYPENSSLNMKISRGMVAYSKSDLINLGIIPNQ